MALFRMAAFAGENRALHPTLIPEAAGTLSLNQNPTKGDLRPWKNLLTVATVASGTQTIYRMGRDAASDSNYWLAFQGPDPVHVVRGPNASDTLERTYYTGNTEPRWTNTTLAISGAAYPNAFRKLGVPAPTTALTAALGTEGDHTGLFPNDYYYTYTYVTVDNEESAPAPVSARLVRYVNDAAVLSAFTPPPAGYSSVIDRVRVYRTQTGSDATSFFFLREDPVAGLTTLADDNRQLQEVLETKGWLPPPADLKCLTGLWGGMMAGISGRGVRLCEPNVAYAWPIAYEYVPLDYTPVALGAFAQNLVVLTNGAPMILSGTAPDSMDEMPLDFVQSCLAVRSVVNMGHGVAWASPDGLAYIGSGGPRLLTAGIMDRRDWQAINPSSIIACMYEGRYVASYLDGATRKGFVLDPSNPAGVYFTDLGFTAAYTDDLQDTLYVLIGTSVRKWDAGATARIVSFRSRLFRTPRPIPAPSCAQVIADAYPVLLTVYADGLTVFEEDVTSTEPVRLPGGYHAQEFQLEVSSPAPVQSVAMAHSFDELGQV